MNKARNVETRLGFKPWLWVLFLLPGSGLATANEWPQEIETDEVTIVIYQPQPENVDGNRLTARAAMSLEPANGKDPVYGVFWFSAAIETDRSADTASIGDFVVTKVAWPDSKDTGEQRFTQVVEKALSEHVLQVSLTALKASLATSEKVQDSLENLNNDPPTIRFSQELAVLLMFDGKPRFKAIENSPYESAMNAPMAVARDTRNKQFYLTSGSLWYQAKAALGPWQATTKPPQDLVDMVPKSEDPTPKRIPAIVAVTEPTELIVSDGKPGWESLDGGKLLYVKNTETPWLRDLASGNMYVQLSGRWYRSKSEQGPWTFVRGDKLPDSFKEIPPASDIGGVRTSVAGTDEANEAMANAHIPQTAAIKRDQASLSVEYDGAPKFEAITGTEVAYAVNTASQVLRIDGKFYAVDNGVWFTAGSANGPWAVADSIPSDKIAVIPPSSPVYNTTYVTVYDSTPELVYVGYTPGYMWSYPYYGIPVYGTGWYYPPYWGGGYYYPRTPTWGFHVGYNPWTGWNFGVSWGGPFLRVGVIWGGRYRCCGVGWHGGRYRNNNININTGDINIGNNVNIGNRNKMENKLSNREHNNNIYNNKENRHRNADKTTARSNLKQARSNPQRKNDLYAGKNGQVARKQSDQWQVRQDNSWKNVATEKKASRDQVQRTQPSTHILQSSRDLSSRPSHSQTQRQQFNHSSMNRDFSARQRGARGGRRR